MPKMSKIPKMPKMHKIPKMPKMLKMTKMAKMMAGKLSYDGNLLLIQIIILEIVIRT